MKKGSFLRWLEKKGLYYRNTPTKKRDDAITVYSPLNDGRYVRVSGFDGGLLRVTSYGRYAGSVTGEVCRNMIRAMCY